MDVVTVRFTTHWPWNPTSAAIARLGGSKQWSHVMGIIDGTAYEATMLHGCRVVPIDVAMVGVASYQDMLVPVPSVAAAAAFGQAQGGAGYDWAALLIPFMASDDWADGSKWWCSELVFAMLAAGGAELLDPIEQTRVTPDDLHQCDFPKSAIVQLR